jgi:hypothetical protein
MKTNFYTILFVFLLLFSWSCQKEDKQNPADEQGVSFSMATQTTLKSSDCFSRKADYVKLVINEKDYKLEVFYIDNKPYTKTLKLDVGNYTLSEFLFMDDNNTPDDQSDDMIIAATPHKGSEFAKYVPNPLNITFKIEAFKKSNIEMTVVCYQERDHASFGFVFFGIGQIVVREQYFFGDICISSLKEYAGSLYEKQSGGLQPDMPAIAKIEVWRNGELKDTFSNEEWLGEGKPLTVRYADILNQKDEYRFKLYILVRKGNSFHYVYFHSWKFNDNELIPAGEDGVVEFVLGNCQPDADLILPPWINLPPSVKYTITGWNPPLLGGYVDATLSEIPEGYKLTNGVYASNCADHATPINVMVTYHMSVFSSLYPDKLPVFAQSHKWEKINWLYNHLDWYPDYKWYDIQGFIWLYDDPAWNGQPLGTVPALTDLSKKMKEDADKYGPGYKVPPGGMAALVFVPVGSGSTAVIQTMFIQIDQS